MLEVKNIQVDLGGVTILRDVSLGISIGKVVAVVGPNGAGKSTLFGAMSGAINPKRGTVELDRHDLRTWPSERLACRRAILPQQSELTFPFRVLEVVLLGRSPHRGSSSPENDLAIARLALLETETLHLADRVYTTLSGGERQRVHLARVLAQIGFCDTGRKDSDPVSERADSDDRFLLLDEPTSSLDPAHQHMTLQTAVRAAERGIGVVTVLHDLNLAAMYADQVVMLKDGRIVSQGAPVDVLTEALIEEVFELVVSVVRHPRRGCPYVIAA